MKKITIILVACLCIIFLFSCKSSDNGKVESTTDSTYAANSASENIVITRDKILSVIDEQFEMEGVSAKSDKSVSVNDATAELIPECLSEEFVKELTTENYGEYKKLFTDYVNKVSDAIESLVSELPKKCTFTYWPRWSPNFGRRLVSNYTVLDTNAVPEDGEEFVLFLSYNFYELKFNKEYDKYYDADMDSLAERYSNVGDVLIDFLGEWYFFDTETLELEEIELFPNYEKVKNVYSDLIADKLNEEESTVAGE